MKALPVTTLALSVLSSLACSPAADPIGKGSMSFAIEFPTDTSVGSCSLPGTAGIGSPPPDLPVVQGEIDRLGETRTDGEALANSDGEYEVKCTVTKGGRLDIDISGLNDTVGSFEAGLQITGSIDPDDGTGNGNVTVRTVDAGSTPNTSGCVFQAIADGDDFAISEGRAQFTFTCPMAVPNADDFAVCSTRGSVVVRDCLTE